MSLLPPLDVKVNAKKWSCILDMPLALSRWGLMTAWRLAEEMNVWMVPYLWEFLDGVDFYLDKPDVLQRLADLFDGTEADFDPCVIQETLNQWQTARLEADLQSVPIFWAGDARVESMLPKNVNGDVALRFPILAKTLEARMQTKRLGCNPKLAYVHGSRDAAALTAALAQYRPLIFTVGGEADTAPFLCRYLEACDVRCERAPWGSAHNPMRQYLEPAIIRSGLAELVWAGMPLSVVHIVAPRAFLMSRPGYIHSDFRDFLDYGDTSGPQCGPKGDWWVDAVAIWYPLT